MTHWHWLVAWWLFQFASITHSVYLLSPWDLAFDGVLVTITLVVMSRTPVRG